MSKRTFRDFAGAIMAGDTTTAGEVLEELLALEPARGADAARHFQQAMTQGGPAFMGKAMGLRTAVAGGNDGQIKGLLGECFGLGGAEADAAVKALEAGWAR